MLKIKINDNNTDNGEVITLKSNNPEIEISQISSGSYNIEVNNRSHFLDIIKHDKVSNQIRLRFDNKLFSISIINEHIDLMQIIGINPNEKKSIKELTAPMPGMILDIRCKEGEKVSEGEQLIILEAMKMENILYAPKDVSVKSILIKKGDSVEKHQKLIDFD